MSRPWLKIVVPPLGILVVYFTVPVDADRAPVGVALGLLVSLLALAVVVLAMIREAGREERRLTGLDLILALQVTLVVFSFGYYLLASNDPGEFEGMTTRLDALYFSTTTVATVGYGDIHAKGQFARGLVTANMVFNLIFIAALLNMAKEAFGERRRAARTEPRPKPE